MALRAVLILYRPYTYFTDYALVSQTMLILANRTHVLLTMLMFCKPYSYFADHALVLQTMLLFSDHTYVLQAARPLLHIFTEVHHIVIILLVHISGGNQEIRCRLIVGYGNIVYLRDAQQRLHIRVVGLGRQGI